MVVLKLCAAGVIKFASDGTRLAKTFSVYTVYNAIIHQIAKCSLETERCNGCTRIRHDSSF